ncbi:MAG: AAA family ATPase [Pseudomonadota bacterium]|nr:AAA family ATPase [Pseudomonadota bacterium]
MKRSIPVMVSGRFREAVNKLGPALGEHPRLEIQERVVTNGHVDPLQGATGNPEILVLVASELWREELEALISRPAAERPELIVIGSSADAEMMRLAMQAGARDYFTFPINTSDILSSIEKIAVDIDRNRGASSGSLTAVMNAKGGSGSSFVASNVAHILAARDDLRVALIDLDLQFGAIPLYFDVTPRQDLYEALTTAEHLDSAALRGFATSHGSGLHVFASTLDTFHLSGDVPAEKLSQFLELCLKTYDRVVLDLPRHVDPLVARALEYADSIFVVVQQSVAHIRDAKRLMRVITRELAIPEKGVKVVVNRRDDKGSVSVNDVASALKEPYTIQNDFKRVSESVNLGTPMYELFPRAAVTRSLSSLADTIGRTSVQPSRGFLGGTLSHLFGR